jgi:hypothetical protein
MLFTVMDRHLPATQVHRDIIVKRLGIREVLLDHFAFVSKNHDELFDPVRGLNLHAVPEDRLASDFRHGIRSQDGYFG